MPDLHVEEVGFYEWIELDDRGLPKRWKPFPAGVIPPNIEQFEIYLRLSGKPGSYWLTVDVESYTEHPEVKLSFDSFHVVIRPDSYCHLTIPVPLQSLPMGKYRFVLKAANQRLARLTFTVGYASPLPN